MRFNEISGNDTVLSEYGRHGYPGAGQRLFSQKFYQYMVNNLRYLDDSAVQEFLVNWMCDIFKLDNPKFNEDLFKKAIEDGKSYSASPEFQQRHFYYLAHHVSLISDMHAREYVCHWLGKVAGRTNSGFKPSLWEKFCGI